jgi:hypothetical protein
MKFITRPFFPKIFDSPSELESTQDTTKNNKKIITPSTPEELEKLK